MFIYFGGNFYFFKLSVNLFQSSRIVFKKSSTLDKIIEIFDKNMKLFNYMYSTSKLKFDGVLSYILAHNFHIRA